MQPEGKLVRAATSFQGFGLAVGEVLALVFETVGREGIYVDFVENQRQLKAALESFSVFIDAGLTTVKYVVCTHEQMDAYRRSN